MNHESEAASNPDPTSGAQWIRGTSTSLKRTRQGFTLFLYGCILVCLAAFGVLYFEFSTEMLSVVIQVLPVTALMGNLIILAGALLFFSVPHEVNSRGVLIGAAVGFFAKIIFSATVFCVPGFLGVPLALSLKLAGYLGLVLFALFLRKLLLYLNRSDQLWKVYGLLVATVLFLLGSWCLELMVDLGLITIALIPIYSVMLVGLFLYPCFVYSLKKVLSP
ncbi:hypothetical protein [uncultured Gimesia sp.]|jgi:hypothetical protein|uniref:hypothetical protein n=1 Tax=uncultured Gimesia sp. TaxID=1678688 RepID=UPI002624DD22|nr:hypothetical protein [uncultured Gimesia sp.]